MIEGVIITPLKQMFDERGKVMHMLRKDSEIFTEFGEIYFSCTNPGAVKAWHLHKKMTLNYGIDSGKIKLVLYDDRPMSSTKGEIQEIFLTHDDYFTVIIPPLIWNGFKSVENKTAIIANCSDIPHNSNEIIRKRYDDPSIPYNWKIKHK